MNNTISKIADFPEDGALWRLDMLGPFLRNGVVPSDPLIEIGISKVPEENQSFGYQDPPRRIVRTSAGYLPFIRIGSVWKNGCRVDSIGHVDEKRARFSSVQIDKSTTRILPANLYKLEDDTKKYLVSPLSYSFGSVGLKSKLLGVDHAGVENLLLIPTVEVGRFYYFNSTSLTQRLLWGRLDPDRNNLFNPKVSTLAEDGTGTIKLRKDIPDSDAWVVSRLAHSPFALKKAKQIHSSLVRCQANDEPASPDIYFPFEGETNLRVRGKWINSWGERRFLVFWIESCSHPFPAKKLLLYSDNDGRSDGVVDLSREVAYGGPKMKREGTGNNLRSDTEPRNDTLSTTILLSSARFTDLLNKSVEKPPKENCEYRAADTGGVVNNDATDGYSSGEGDWGDNNAAPVRVNNVAGEENPAKKTMQRRPPYPPSLDAIRDVISALQALGSITVRYPGGIAGTWDFSLSGEAWPSIDHRPRQALVAELIYNGRYFYLFELERKKSERYTTLFSHHSQFTPLSATQIWTVLDTCAANTGTWYKKDELPGLYKRKFKHSWSDPAIFAQTLFDVIQGRSRKIVGQTGRSKGTGSVKSHAVLVPRKANLPNTIIKELSR